MYETEMDAGKSLDGLIDDLDRWLNAERVRLRPAGRYLKEEERDFLSRYFSLPVLTTIRVLPSPDLSIVERPAHYATVARADAPPPIDFARIRGLTLFDTIIMAQARIPDANSFLATLFQECVHVCQFRNLGSRQFLSQYLRYWQQHRCCHDDIPLEREAASLMTRALARPDRPFPVEPMLASSVNYSLEAKR